MYMIIEVALGKAVDKVSVAVIGLPLIGVVLMNISNYPTSSGSTSGDDTHGIIA